jgi:hypothetical protein
VDLVITTSIIVVLSICSGYCFGRAHASNKIIALRKEVNRLNTDPCYAERRARNIETKL